MGCCEALVNPPRFLASCLRALPPQTQPRLCCPSATTVLTPVTASFPISSFPAQLLLPPPKPGSNQDSEGQHGREQTPLASRSTQLREGAEGPKEATWRDCVYWDHSSPQARVTSDFTKAQGCSRTTAEGPQVPGLSETGLCKAEGSSIEEASGTYFTRCHDCL